MALPRFRKLDETKRNGILQAAAAEFADQGFTGASFNYIIARAGLSKGAMYYYFADKEDVYRTVIETAAEALLDRMQPERKVASATEYWAEWEAMYRRMIGFLEAEPTKAILLWDCIRARARGTGHPVLPVVAERIFDRIRGLMRLGQDVGAVRTDLPEDLLLNAVFGMLEGVDRWLAERWSAVRLGEVGDVPEQVVRLLRRLAAPASEAGS